MKCGNLVEICLWPHLAVKGLKRSRVLILYKPGFSQAFFLKLQKKKAMILFTSLIGDKTKTEEGFTCRQYSVFRPSGPHQCSADC